MLEIQLPEALRSGRVEDVSRTCQGVSRRDKERVEDMSRACQGMSRKTFWPDLAAYFGISGAFVHFAKMAKSLKQSLILCAFALLQHVQ